MKKKTKIITIIGIVSLILTIGISYAIYVASISQSGEGTILSKCIGITKTSEENNINLQNAMPMTDSDGLELIPYTLTVTNTCDVATNFIITVDLLNIEGKTSSDYIPSSVVKSSVNGTTTLLGNNEEYTQINNSYESRIIYYGIFAGLETKEFNIRMWLDERATVEQAGNKYLNTKISVYSGQVPTSVDNIIVDIDDNMIPIMYYNNEWVVADKTNTNETYKWYDYEEKQWANAVTIVPSELATYKAKNVGDIIDNDDIMGYFVYIPRYRYKLWNVNNDGAQLSNEQEIIIEFENKNVGKVLGNTNGTYLTHPAFTLGSRELNGFWIGKFETSSPTNYTAETTSEVALQNGVYVKPYLGSDNIQYSLRWMNVYNQYLTATAISGSYYHNLSNATESGMLKNSQWGSVAYLSHSIYGTCNGAKGSATCTEVGLNSHSNYYTGVGPQTSGNYNSSGTTINIYTSNIGKEASTTKTIYGVNDMSGGAFEYVMGVMKTSGNIEPYYRNSGFNTENKPNKEYIDLYDYGTTYAGALAFKRGLLGDATKEIIKGISDAGGWYKDSSSFVDNSYSWLLRGGRSNFGNFTGVFSFHKENGSAYSGVGFRIFLAKK